MSILTRTDRVTLRRIAEDDCQQLYKLDNDPEVMLFINGGSPTPIEIIRNEILPVFLQVDDGAACFGFWAVIANDTSDFLGWCCLRRRKGSGDIASIGYRFHKTSWGKGYATEAATALMMNAFTSTDIRRLIANTYELNHGSRHVLEKLGMKFARSFDVSFEGADTCYMESEEPWDGKDVEYGIDKTEWEAL